MHNLKDIVSSSNSFVEGLKINGQLHKNYKSYTSLDRAKEVLLTGYIYLNNGATWNDIEDSSNMKERGTYGMCFSYSTRENVAMWMLYSGNRGKNGAALNFYPSIIKEINNASTIEIGKVNPKKNIFEKVDDLYRRKGEFEIFMTDVVYVDPCKDNKSRITIYDESIIVGNKILNNDQIFTKNYAWSYEKECRIVVKPKVNIQDESCSIIRIKLSQKSIAKLNEDRIIRSPIYKGKVSYGRDSDLVGKVNWDL